MGPFPKKTIGGLRKIEMNNFTASTEHFKETIAGQWETKELTQFRLTVYHKEKIIHITGQSSNDDDWPDNLDFRSRPVQWFLDKKEIVVHAGFLRQYNAVRNYLLDVAYEHSDYAIRVDGFSLGGSWTQLFVQDIIHRWPNRDMIAIFYGPGNPWRKLPQKYKNALNKCVIFVRSIWDPVTWMRIIRFYRYGKNINIGKWYRIWPIQHHPDQIIRGLKELKGS